MSERPKPPRFLDLDVPYVFVSAEHTTLNQADVQDLLSSDLVAFDCEGAHLVQVSTHSKAYLFYVADPGVRRVHGDLLRKVLLGHDGEAEAAVLLGFASARDFEILADAYPEVMAFAFHHQNNHHHDHRRRAVVDVQKTWLNLLRNRDPVRGKKAAMGRLGLSSVCLEILGAPLCKANQRAMWRTSDPASYTHDMLSYAALDARCLIRIVEACPELLSVGSSPPRMTQQQQQREGCCGIRKRERFDRGVLEAVAAPISKGGAPNPAFSADSVRFARRYLRAAGPGADHLWVTYARNSAHSGWTRLNAESTSQQNMPRELRVAIVPPRTWELDVTNLHPTLMLHLAHEAGCSHLMPCLRNYVDDRERVMTAMADGANVSRDVIKRAFLRALYTPCDSPKDRRHREDIRTVMEKYGHTFEAATRDALTLLQHMYRRPEEEEACGGDGGGDDNTRRVMLNKRVQLLESRILDAMCRSLGERGCDDSEFVLLHDGVTFTDTRGLLRSCAEEEDLLSGVEKDVRAHTGVSLHLRLANIRSLSDVILKEEEEEEDGCPRAYVTLSEKKNVCLNTCHRFTSASKLSTPLR